MTATDNFVSRWARLKGEGASTRKTNPVAEVAQLVPVVSPEVRSNSAQHRGDAAVDEPFDPASLPSIDAIAADTDIRAFLHSSISVELTRLALRRAWASDPAIRDFRGIAENQWDFNDPDAIPGFGPLRMCDYLPYLLQQALGEGDRLEQTLAASLPTPCQQVRSPVPDREPVNPDRSRRQALEAPLATGSDRPEIVVVGGDGKNIGISGDRVIEAREDALDLRSHGSALPRFRT
jgi:hypothetical protein